MSEFESVPWRAQPGPQLKAIQCHMVPELFFGGAVGGGKSDFLLGDYAQDVARYGANWTGILFRRSYPQLEELVARSKQIYPAWFNGAEFTIGNHLWKWPNGATLKFRHADDEDAWMEYQGHQYQWIGWDEMPQWPTPNLYRQMKTRLRNGAQAIPNKRIRGTGNPGGVGHGWIKKYFAIDKFPLGDVLLPSDSAGGQRMFIRSSVTDNKILLANDPEYIARLRGLGSEALVKMYLAGDWNVIAGAFYPEFDAQRHIIEPFPIPKGWTRFRSMDWGSSAPFSVGWYAVADGSIVEYPNAAGEKWFPRGALVKYREWYGMREDEANVGLKLTAEEVADGILAREDKGEKMDMSVIDPSAFKIDGGPSIAERMAKRKVYFQRGDNNRKAGWDQLRQRLKGDIEGDPMLYFSRLCGDTIRTLPMLQHDRGKAANAVEDVDTTGEDHAGDETRYACMSRPWARPGQATPPAPTWNKGTTFQGAPTFADIVSQRTRARRARENR
ncbi:MAG TPA: hypothetical protein VFA39_15720 [Steroidobacteraceae bacterium]|nr:hypothetical protein [Steroidobacteraceae bacterium]